MAKTLPALVSEAAVQGVVHDVRTLVGIDVPVDRDLIAAAVRGWSANTRRAFAADLCLWGQWCRSHATVPRLADGRTVAEWIRTLAGIEPNPLWKVRAMATIERYLVSVSWAYRMAALDDPTAAALVKLEKKAARKVLGTAQRQARAIRFKGAIADLDSPASGVCLVHLLQSCRRDLLGQRDAALLRLAYDTGCRRSELVAIEVTHIEGPDGEGAGTLFLPRSKTDQTGEGAFAYLAPATMAAIARWRDGAGIETGPLFRRVFTHFDGTVQGVGDQPLHPNSIAPIYRRLIRAAHAKKLLGAMSEKELERWVVAVSSHSIRVGVAQDSIAANEELPAIMQAYRWRDPKTVMRYGAKLVGKSGTSARLAARFADD